MLVSQSNLGVSRINTGTTAACAPMDINDESDGDDISVASSFGSAGCAFMSDGAEFDNDDIFVNDSPCGNEGN